MPNIELYGYEKESDVQEIIVGIQTAFKGKPYEGDYVITVMNGSYVINHGRKRHPFIRLVTTRNDHNDEILEVLRKLTADLEGVDVEYALLENFFPKVL